MIEGTMRYLFRDCDKHVFYLDEPCPACKIEKLQEDCRLGYQALADLAKKDSEFDRLETFCAGVQQELTEAINWGGELYSAAIANKQRACDELGKRRALEYDLESARGALRLADFLAQKKIQELERLKDNPGPDWITRSQADDSIEKAITAERTAREAAEGEVERMKGKMLDVLHVFQRLQPGGSPPPGDAYTLAMWIVATTQDRIEAAEARVRVLEEALLEIANCRCQTNLKVCNCVVCIAARAPGGEK